MTMIMMDDDDDYYYYSFRQSGRIYVGRQIVMETLWIFHWILLNEIMYIQYERYLQIYENQYDE